MVGQDQDSPRTPKLEQHGQGGADLSEYSPSPDAVLYKNTYTGDFSSGSLYSVNLTPVKVVLRTDDIEPAPHPPVFSLLSSFSESVSGELPHTHGDTDAHAQARTRYAATLFVVGVFLGFCLNIISFFGMCFVRRKYFSYYVAGCSIGAIMQTTIVLISYFNPYNVRA